MRLILFIFSLIFISNSLSSQVSLKGIILDQEDEPIVYANLTLHNASDSNLVKVQTTDLDGVFTFSGITPGSYFIKGTYVGYADLLITDIVISESKLTDLGIQRFQESGVELETATITASRSILEVKPDRTVFNVEGTINSTGDNGLGLLRKAPGVLVDNNNNITVLSRSGVLIYVDGKRLPLSGDQLTSYLENLPAERIDRIDIITNPGARYEAQGNAGIIDIRLKKDKNLGSNGSVNTNYSKGRFAQAGLGGSGNYRNKFMNVFGSVNLNTRKFYNNTDFINYQNGLVLDETNYFEREGDGYNVRLGSDFFISDNSTIGFMVNSGANDGIVISNNRSEISGGGGIIDSILIANNNITSFNSQNTFNLNYKFDDKKHLLNIDLDYGRYRNANDVIQPNEYFNVDETTILSSNYNAYNTPVEIDIKTAKADYETSLFDGSFGLGTKFSKVTTDNTFLFYDIEEGGNRVRNDRRSNRFLYDENVIAGYVNYSRKLAEKWNGSAGVRLERTIATGDLQAYLSELEEEPVEFDYLSYFPSFGVTYNYKPKHAFSMNYGRRINRPDYNVLNPFKSQASELSFNKGNPFLKPEIVNNLEFGYTLNFMYNFKIAYSKTLDQITRLIGPDENDTRAGFISWDNLSEQEIYNLSISAPIQITKFWNAYVNFNGGHVNNQADYGEGGVVDVQAWTWNVFQQSTFNLPWKLKGEISGWYSGPGVWGGVFIYRDQWSLNLGLQRRFLNDKLNIRLSFNDIFYQSGWKGYSEFNGLYAEGEGNWDSRRGSISINYNFGNQNVKSRNRNTGLEDESSRIGDGN